MISLFSIVTTQMSGHSMHISHLLCIHQTVTHTLPIITFSISFSISIVPMLLWLMIDFFFSAPNFSLKKVDHRLSTCQDNFLQKFHPATSKYFNVKKGEQVKYNGKIFRTGVEPVTYGFQTCIPYSPPLYQLSYRKLVTNWFYFFQMCDLMNDEFKRRWQDSNLRSQRETDFQSVALTTRPHLLITLQNNNF